MLEKEVEAYLREQVQALGGLCMKFLSDYSRGMPDRVLLLPGGTVIWAELKTDGGRLSTAQRVAHEKLRRLSQRVVVIWSREDVDKLIEEYKRKTGTE